MTKVNIEYLDSGIDSEGIAWIAQEITLDVDKDMALSEETLDDDMCGLPKTISYYAEIAAECQAKAARKKHQMEVAEADAAQTIRIAAKDNNEKITEAGIKEQVMLSSFVSQASHDYYDADRQHRMMDGFYRALREKASLSIALCYKQKEEIRIQSSPLND